MPDTLLLGGARTPFSRFGGALREVPSVELAAFGMRAALAHAGIAPADVNEVYSGVTIPAEEALDGSIPARVAMLRAGIPEDRLSLTLDRACCSSMTAVQLAMRAIGERRGGCHPGRRGRQHGTGRLPDDAGHPVGHPPGRPAAEGPDGRARRGHRRQAGGHT